MAFQYDEFAATAPQWYKAVTAALVGGDVTEAEKLAQEQFSKKREVPSLLAMTNVYLASGDSYNAKPLLEEAMELAKGKDKAAVLHATAKAKAIEKNFEDISGLLAEALDIYEKAQDKLGEASVLNSRALLSDPALYETDAESNLDLANLALSTFKDAKDTQGTAAVLDTIVQLKLREGKASHALMTAEEMVKVYSAAKDEVGVANALIRVGEIYKVDGNLQEAFNKTQEAYQVYSGLPGHKKKCTAINKLAQILSLAGSYDDAHKAGNASLNICRDLKDKRGQALALGMLGSICDTQNESSKAIYKLQKAAALFSKLDDKKEEAVALDAMAQMQLKAFWSVDHATEPASNCEKAMKILGEIGMDDSVLAAYVLNTYAFALLACQRSEEAIEKAKDALSTFQEASNAGGEAFTLSTIAQIHWQLKQKTEAIDMANKAMAVAEEAGDAGEAAWARELLIEFGGLEEKKGPTFEFTNSTGQTITQSQVLMYGWGMVDYFMVDGFTMRGVIEQKKPAKKGGGSSSSGVHDDQKAKDSESNIKHNLDFASLG